MCESIWHISDVCVLHFIQLKSASFIQVLFIIYQKKNAKYIFRYTCNNTKQEVSLIRLRPTAFTKSLSRVRIALCCFVIREQRSLFISTDVFQECTAKSLISVRMLWSAEQSVPDIFYEKQVPKCLLLISTNIWSILKFNVYTTPYKYLKSVLDLLK